MRARRLAVALLVAAAPARAADDPALAAELRARTQAMSDAIVVGDKAVWDAALDPAVIYVTENDIVMDKAAVLADLTVPAKGISGRSTVTGFKLQRHGDTAIATYENDEALDYFGQAVRTHFRVTDTWHRGADGWRIIGSQVLAVLDDPPAIVLDPAQLAQYAGRYVLTPEIKTTLRVDGTRLLAQRDGRPATELKAEAPDLFFTPGSPRSRRVFKRDAAGRITGFADRREGHDIEWRRER